MTQQQLHNVTNAHIKNILFMYLCCIERHKMRGLRFSTFVTSIKIVFNVKLLRYLLFNIFLSA